jgi:acyl-CoA thioesterase-1
VYFCPTAKREELEMIDVRAGDKVVFIGDSITDAGRTHDDQQGLGYGYVRHAAGAFALDNPRHSVSFFNRGVGGDRVRDLESRWTRDVVKVQPQIVSIAVGINDTGRRYDQNDATTTASFEANYRLILERTKTETTASILVLEPFVLPVLTAQIAYREDLDPKIQVVRRLAEEFGATLLGTDSLFAQHASLSSSRELAFDGIHPTAAGHLLLARAWLSLVRAV